MYYAFTICMNYYYNYYYWACITIKILQRSWIISTVLVIIYFLGLSLSVFQFAQLISENNQSEPPQTGLTNADISRNPKIRRVMWIPEWTAIVVTTTTTTMQISERKQDQWTVLANSKKCGRCYTMVEVKRSVKLLHARITSKLGLILNLLLMGPFFFFKLIILFHSV